MARSVGEARQIAELCRSHGIKTIVSHQQKYLTSMQKAKEIADSGESIICKPCALRFAVEDNIPNMLIDEAAPLGADPSSASEA